MMGNKLAYVFLVCGFCSVQTAQAYDVPALVETEYSAIIEDEAVADAVKNTIKSIFWICKDQGEQEIKNGQVCVPPIHSKKNLQVILSERPEQQSASSQFLTGSVLLKTKLKPLISTAQRAKMNTLFPSLGKKISQPTIIRLGSSFGSKNAIGAVAFGTYLWFTEALPHLYDVYNTENELSEKDKIIMLWCSWPLTLLHDEGRTFVMKEDGVSKAMAYGLAKVQKKLQELNVDRKMIAGNNSKNLKQLGNAYKNIWDGCKNVSLESCSRVFQTMAGKWFKFLWEASPIQPLIDPEEGQELCTCIDVPNQPRFKKCLLRNQDQNFEVYLNPEKHTMYHKKIERDILEINQKLKDKEFERKIKDMFYGGRSNENLKSLFLEKMKLTSNLVLKTRVANLYALLKSEHTLSLVDRHNKDAEYIATLHERSMVEQFFIETPEKEFAQLWRIIQKPLSSVYEAKLNNLYFKGILNLNNTTYAENERAVRKYLVNQSAQQDLDEFMLVGIGKFSKNEELLNETLMNFYKLRYILKERNSEYKYALKVIDFPQKQKVESWIDVVLRNEKEALDYRDYYMGKRVFNHQENALLIHGGAHLKGIEKYLIKFCKEQKIDEYTVAVDGLE